MHTVRRGLLFSLLAGLLGLGSMAAPSLVEAQRFEIRGEFERPRVRARVSVGRRIPAPPPARVEVRPAPPRNDMVWRRGYWNWEGRAHVWVPGRWIVTRPGYVWQDPSWVQGPDGSWRLVEGRWVLSSTPPPPPVVYTPPPPPYPPASRYDDDDGRYGSRYDDDHDHDYDHDYDEWDDPRLSELRVFTSPAYGPPRRMGRRAGYYLWVDTQGVWHLRAGSMRPREREFEGRIRGAQGTTVRVLSTTPQDPEDMVRQTPRGVRFDLVTYGSMEGFDFVIEGGNCARVRLGTDDEFAPKRIYVGGDGRMISGSSFLVCRR